MARKTKIEANKDDGLMVGTQVPMYEGDVALENFEHLAKKIFSGSTAETRKIRES
jgi:hypothetical protein